MNAILRASCSLLQIDVVFGVCQFLDYQVLFPNTCSKLSTIFQREMCGMPSHQFHVCMGYTPVEGWLEVYP